MRKGVTSWYFIYILQLISQPLFNQFSPNLISTLFVPFCIMHHFVGISQIIEEWDQSPFDMLKWYQLMTPFLIRNKLNLCVNCVHVSVEYMYIK